MATYSANTEQFAKNVAFFALGVPVAMTKAVAQSGLAVKAAVEITEQQATGGDFVLSGMRKRTPLITPKSRVFTNAGDPYAIVGVRGPAHLIEWDTAPHSTAKRSRSQAKAGKIRKRLAPGLHGPTLSGPAPGRGALTANHPGTTGKHPFERAVNTAAPSVMGIMASAFSQHMTRCWR